MCTKCIFHKKINCKVYENTNPLRQQSLDFGSDASWNDHFQKYVHKMYTFMCISQKKI